MRFLSHAVFCILIRMGIELGLRGKDTWGFRLRVGYGRSRGTPCGCPMGSYKAWGGHKARPYLYARRNFNRKPEQLRREKFLRWEVWDGQALR